MEKLEAEDNLKLIREVMERSSRFTHLSGLPGVIAGCLTLAGCLATAATAYTSRTEMWYQHIPQYVAIWVCVFVLSIAQDFYLGYRKASKAGERYFTPATFHVIKAVLPGVFVGFIISIVCLYQSSVDAIPAIWALGYGAALCAAGIFTVKEVRIFGVIQLLTGAAGLVFFAGPLSSLYFLAVSFGIYHIVFGIWMAIRYGW